MGYQRNKKNLCQSDKGKGKGKNDKGKRSADKNRKTQEILKILKVTDLLKTSKHAHYHKYFEENKKNCRALWIGINETVYSKTKNKTNSPLSQIQDGKTNTDQKHT